MNVSDFISKLDDARYGQRRVTEDDAKSSEGTVKKGYEQPSGSSPAPIAKSPSHAPTSTAQWKTTGKAKSEDEGEAVKKGYKQPSASIPTPVAAAPSHNPTSGKDYTTTGEGSSKDEGEAIKKAVKETINALLNDDAPNLDALFERGAHKAGCECGFCKNKGSFGKKKKEDEGSDDSKEGDEMKEAQRQAHRRPVQETHGAPMPIKRRIGGERPGGAPGAGRMGFRQQVRRPGAGAPPPKAAINPMQPSMESVTRAADRLLDAPE